MKMPFPLTFLAVLLLAAAPAVRAADEAATVKNSRVNVRGQATMKSEVVTQLKKGEPVVVLEEVPDPKAKKGEPALWLRIALPTNTPVWVNALFVSNNIVLPNKLNIRSGPGESFSVLARLDKGTTIKPIRTFEGWIEIEAPATASAFVASDQITRGAPAPAAVTAPATAPAPAAPTVETVKVETTPAPVAAAPETKLAKAVPTPAPVEAKPAGPAAASPVAGAKSASPAAAAETAKAAEPEKKGLFSFLRGSSSKKVEAPKAEKAKPAPKAEDTEALPKRIVTREGIVRRAMNLQAPTDYALESTDNGKLINYLFTTVNLPWAALKGRTVIVTGEEAIDKRWPNTPVLKIETLKTLP